ncbi:adhesion G-protein coupled receptor G6-like [Protopterus annectens]|uniref:adhesion G-protein coupled receptor G6-like n=1 Tax=Protopterus annectens TaxID=7888 RepID=UPI001CFBD8EE|nr:adhesion G-protein coupled receptor G6-like [Protopterus annectens]
MADKDDCSIFGQTTAKPFRNPSANNVAVSDEGADMVDCFKRMGQLSRKVRSLVWHNKLLKAYLQAKVIPRGLRLHVEPGVGSDNQAFMSKWRAVQSTASKMFIELLIDYYDVQIIESNTMLRACQERIFAFSDTRQYKELYSQFKIDMDKHERELQARKMKKYARDVNDYKNNLVYTWKQQKRGVRFESKRTGTIKRKRGKPILKNPLATEITDYSSSFSNTDTDNDMGDTEQHSSPASKRPNTPLGVGAGNIAIKDIEQMFLSNLQAISRTEINEKDDIILTIIAYIGCGISCIFLGVILVTYIVFEKLRRDYPSKILMNLCSALLWLNIMYLVNSWLASFKNSSLCISVAVFLHFFLLASFTWMGLEAVHMYFALVKVFNTYIHNFIIKFCIAGWGIPAAIVAIVLAINKDFYGTPSPSDGVTDFCWITNEVVFYVTVVTYFTIIFLMNLAMFIVVLIQINRMTKKQHNWKAGLFHDLKSTATLTFLLGLTWGFAFFAWDPVKIPFLYLFSITNSLQGFFIFVFQCMMKENVIKQWRIHLCCGRFRRNEYTEWTRSVSNAKSKHQSLAKKSPEESRKSIKSNSTSSTSNTSVSERTFTVSLQEDHLYDNQAFTSSSYTMNMTANTQRISAKEFQNYYGNHLDVPAPMIK